MSATPPEPAPPAVAAPRVVFVGAVEEGRRCLAALVEAGERFAGIVTITPELRATTSGWARFDELAAAIDAPLIEVRDLNAPENVARLAELRADLLIVVGWTRLLGGEVLALPRLGAVGFHASLLPRYRGRAPVNWALIHDEPATGNTMFFLDEGVDTGDIIDQRTIPIGDDDDVRTLYEKVSDAGTEMLLAHLPALKAGTAPRRAQDHTAATIMPRRRPEDGVIDWHRDARSLRNWVRALTVPYPGAFSTLDGRRVIIWQARVGSTTTTEPPGRLIDAGEGAGEVGVATGDGVLVLERIEWAGEAPVAGRELAAFVGRSFGGEGNG
ncbi:MAG TPA: methionyl-tRNA formyltransferase [Candidatus Limnocylindrales bacterium]|jgi:methionyl-tRNA formyltransferase